MNAWYAAKTKPNKERLVENFLSRIEDIEVFLPIIRHPGTKNNRLEPLFPTYIFCFVDPSDANFPAIRWAPGLSYFLGSGRDIIPVPDEIIAEIKQRVSWWNEDGYISNFTVGEKVLVTDGPFSGLEGIFQRYIPARERCQVLLEIMGRLARVEVSTKAIKGEAPYRGLALAY